MKGQKNDNIIVFIMKALHQLKKPSRVIIAFIAALSAGFYFTFQILDIFNISFDWYAYLIYLPISVPVLFYIYRSSIKYSELCVLIVLLAISIIIFSPRTARYLRNEFMDFIIPSEFFKGKITVPEYYKDRPAPEENYKKIIT